MRKFLSKITLASAALGFSALGFSAVASAAPEETATVAAPAPDVLAPDVSAPEPGTQVGPTALETFRNSQAAVDALGTTPNDTKVRALIDALLDYEWLAVAALGGPKKYSKRCADRCAEFNELLTRLIRRNYLKRIAAKENGVVVIIREETRVRKGKTIAKVDTIVSFTAADDGRPQTLEVSYIMHQVGLRWQVRDMLTDRLSLAKTWKHDFTELYKNGGIDEVITRLQGKLGDLDDLAKTP